MKYWMGTVSKEHVMIGVEGNFCQLCHGKSTPLKRMKKGDILIYYSPKISLNSDVKFQEITAIGKIKDENVYQFQMTENFIPYRRDVDYLKLNGKCTIQKQESIQSIVNIRFLDIFCVLTVHYSNRQI